MTRFLILLFILTTAPRATPLAQTNDPERQYSDCMALAKTNPNAGFERAKRLLKRGGDAAVHCLGVSLLGQKKYIKAANLLAALAREVSANDALRADLFGQAAQGWLMADKPKAAADVLDTAINLAPDNAELLIDRSQALAAQKKFAAAIDDLNLALAKIPGHVDALVFRGSAQRRLKNFKLAANDLEHALALSADHAEALLERGILHHQLDNRDGAGRDWQRVISVAPGSEAAKVARKNLEKITDAKN